MEDDDEGDKDEDYVSDNTYEDEDLEEDEMVKNRTDRIVEANKAHNFWTSCEEISEKE